MNCLIMFAIVKERCVKVVLNGGIGDVVLMCWVELGEFQNRKCRDCLQIDAYDGK